MAWKNKISLFGEIGAQCTIQSRVKWAWTITFEISRRKRPAREKEKRIWSLTKTWKWLKIERLGIITNEKSWNASLHCWYWALWVIDLLLCKNSSSESVK